MLVSDLIKELQRYIDEQGDGTIVFDVPERNCFETVFDLEGMYYTGNFKGLNIGTQPYLFIILQKE